jgi:hypothetical protein
MGLNRVIEKLIKLFPEDSIFRKPLVLDITLVLVIKMILLIILWQVAFKPLKPSAPPDIHVKMGFPSNSTPIQTPIKDANHE